MKKIIYILLALSLLCGCSGEPQDQDEVKEPEKIISKEELLLNYAKEKFVGGLYELKQENSGYMYQTPLRIVIMDTNSASTFAGCDEEQSNVQYIIYETENGEIQADLVINLVCSGETESHRYSSSDNFTNKLY